MKLIDLLAVLVILYLAPFGTSFSFMHSLTRPMPRSILNSISSSTTYSVSRSLNNRPIVTRVINGGIQATRSFGHSNWRPLSYALTNLNHLSITNSLNPSCKRSIFSDSKGRSTDTTKGINTRSKSRNGIQLIDYSPTHRLIALIR